MKLCTVKERHPVKMDAWIDEWAKANPEKRAATRRKYRAAKAGSEGYHTAADIVSIFESQRGLCVVCRDELGSEFEVDHILPIALGGANGKSNIQLLCRGCNRRKSAKHPVTFMQSRGFLL